MNIAFYSSLIRNFPLYDFLFTGLLRNLLCRKHCDCFIEQELLLLVIVTDIIICIPHKLNHKSVHASQKVHCVSESQMF